VFAESEMISQLAAGKKIEDVALGAHKSIAQRVAGLVNRIGISPEVVLSGGVALNESVIRALEKELGYDIIRLKSPQTMGALGAAIYAMGLDKNGTEA
jgi:activator of 2-hydroxyglutaryl-CoA dehydratase